jgi:hypothetical protein
MMKIFRLNFEMTILFFFITNLERYGQDEKALQTRRPPSRSDPLSNIARVIGARFFGLFQPQFIPYQQQQYAPGPPGKLIY